MSYKWLITGILAVSMLAVPVQTYAQAEGSEVVYGEETEDGSFTEKDEKWDVHKAWFTRLFDDCEDCNFVRTGGVNKLDGISSETRAETHALEAHLRENNYVLASTPEKEITDEDVLMLQSISWNGAAYIGNEQFLSDGKYFKAYIYEPTLRTARKQWKANHALDFHVQWEITTSSVLINYYLYDEVDKMGKTFGIEEINERMPYQYQENAGFVEFSCPIDAEITLHLRDHEYFYHLYLQKGKTLVRLRADHYELTEINGHDVERGDLALTNKNYFVVWQQTKEEPLQVEFSKLVERDDIGDTDITGKPDCRWGVVYEDVDVKDEGDVIVDDPEKIDVIKTYEPQKNYKSIIIAGVLVLIFGILTALVMLNRKKR